ncbi:SPW repeat protein [Cytophagaceae bacterium ABcell3]|nr:SPW repeat protein [Cytophagaceae bacterium ABcell3]
MRFISTRAHAYMDYIIGALLIIAPWLLGFAAGGAETIIPVVLGIGTILYSMFSDHEMSASRKLPMNTHLSIDIVAGIFLAVSPWLFGFSGLVWLPHLLVGIVMLLGGIFTSKVAESCPEGTPCYNYSHSR